MSVNCNINNGIANICFDLEGRNANVINRDLMEPFQEAVSKCVAAEDLKGVILTSAKRDFISGADLDFLFEMNDISEASQLLDQFKEVLRQLETLEKPVVAAINGTALGGGFEVALGCHYRICINDPSIKIGLPEVKLGLLPGGGGTQRVMRLLGIQNALPILLEGTEMKPARALSAGLIHELAENSEELMQKAQAWIEANPEVQAPWDTKGFRIPRGDSKHPKVAQMWAITPSIVRQKTWGNYPAAKYIQACLYEGSLLPFDRACQVESAYFARCVASPEAKNMIRAFWYQLQRVRKRDTSLAKDYQLKKVGILGAGMMGAGIAYVTAAQGIQVILIDTDQDRAEAGKAVSKKILSKRKRKGAISAEDMEKTLNLIVPTTNYDDLNGADLIIEAVFENRDIKDKVTKKAVTQLNENGVMASNTSTLPITSLAKSVEDPSKFIGIHFFSPVEKMQLVEIILGKATSDETRDKALAYVQAIKKIPIVVQDSRGFYTSRVFSTYVREGMAMLQEGINPNLIEQAGLMAGMPVGPLAVSDEVSLELMHLIQSQTVKDMEAEGQTVPEHPADMVVQKMVLELKRLGRKSQAGFYDYGPEGKALWPGLAEHWPVKKDPTIEQLITRFHFIQSLETVRCLEEGVLSTVAEANLGSIFGWGFAPFKGGTLQFLNSYGLQQAFEESLRLEAEFGQRFSPPDLLREKATKGDGFYDPEDSNVS